MKYTIEKFYAIGDIQFEVTVDEVYNDIALKFMNDKNATLGPAITMMSPSKEVKRTFAIPGKYIVQFEFRKTENAKEIVWNEGMIQITNSRHNGNFFCLCQFDIVK